MYLDIDDITFPISPSPDAAPFWAGVANHELVIPRCERCERFFWYPRTACPNCGGREISWVTASGRGVVHSFCINFQTSVAHLRDLVPFITALIDLDEGPRLLALLDAAPTPRLDLVGKSVSVDFRPAADGRRIPVFQPLGDV